MSENVVKKRNYSMDIIFEVSDVKFLRISCTCRESLSNSPVNHFEVFFSYLAKYLSVNNPYVIRTFNHFLI